MTEGMTCSIFGTCYVKTGFTLFLSYSGVVWATLAIIYNLFYSIEVRRELDDSPGFYIRWDKIGTCLWWGLIIIAAQGYIKDWFVIH